MFKLIEISALSKILNFWLIDKKWQAQLLISNWLAILYRTSLLIDIDWKHKNNFNLLFYIDWDFSNMWDIDFFIDCQINAWKHYWLILIDKDILFILLDGKCCYYWLVYIDYKCWSLKWKMQQVIKIYQSWCRY